jgi:hypothetical protein
VSGKHRAGSPDWLGLALLVVPTLLVVAAVVVAIVEVVLTKE